MKTYPKVRNIFRSNVPTKQWMTNLTNLVAIHRQYVKTYDTYHQLLCTNQEPSSTPSQQAHHNTATEVMVSPPVFPDEFRLNHPEEEEAHSEEQGTEINQWFKKLKRESSRYLHPDKRHLFHERFPNQSPPTHEWYTELLACFHDEDYCSILILFGDHIDWIQPEPPEKMNDVLIHLTVQISKLSIEMMMEISKKSKEIAESVLPAH